ncbi:MAG: hypothetical protein AAB908_02045 [Patescibacteria group bacterium]
MFRVLAAIVFTLPMLVFAETGEELKTRGTPTPALVTCYAPGPGDKIEGGWATARPRPSGACTSGNGNAPMTLDDVRLGRCKYVSLAANPAFAGRYFYMGTVRYASPIDKGNGKGQEYELTDVIGYVNDTGCAFKAPGESGSCCAKYKTCGNVGKKFDVAVGDFRGWNPTNASQYVDRQRYCSNYSTTFYQIGGAPVTPPQVRSQPVGTGDIAIVKGSPIGTNYGPFGLGTQPYMPPGGIASMYSTQGAHAGQGAYAGTGAQASPLNVGTGGTGTGTSGNGSGVVTTAGARSAGTILIQPQNAKKGSNILVSWTSVNMQPSSCVVRLDGEEFARGNEATKRHMISADASGRIEFTLECETASGEKATAVSSITL